MIKSATVKVDLDQIKIPSNYAKTLPDRKIVDRLHFYKQTGTFDREIVIDEHNNLLDGYSTYLVCKMLDLTKVRALRIKAKFTAQELLKMLREKIDNEIELGA